MAMDGGSLLETVVERPPGAACGAYSQPLCKGQNGRRWAKKRRRGLLRSAFSMDQRLVVVVIPTAAVIAVAVTMIVAPPAVARPRSGHAARGCAIARLDVVGLVGIEAIARRPVQPVLDPLRVVAQTVGANRRGSRAAVRRGSLHVEPAASNCANAVIAEAVAVIVRMVLVHRRRPLTRWAAGAATASAEAAATIGIRNLRIFALLCLSNYARSLPRRLLWRR